MRLSIHIKHYYNNSPDRDPFNSEMYSGATDMGVSMTVTPNMVSKGANVFNFGYAGGNVRYEVNNDMHHRNPVSPDFPDILPHARHARSVRQFLHSSQPRLE